MPKKRNALSIFETMSGPTSPEMKPRRAETPGYVFKSGLVGPFCIGLMFSNLDIFIEKPFSVLSFHICHLCKTSAKTTAAPLKSKTTSSKQYAHARAINDLAKRLRFQICPKGTFVVLTLVCLWTFQGAEFPVLLSSQE